MRIPSTIGRARQDLPHILRSAMAHLARVFLLVALLAWALVVGAAPPSKSKAVRRNCRPRPKRNDTLVEVAPQPSETPVAGSPAEEVPPPSSVVSNSSVEVSAPVNDTSASGSLVDTVVPPLNNVNSTNSSAVESNGTLPDSFPPVTPLSTEDISKFRPLTVLTGIAYCPPNVTLTWSCGENCDANKGFVPYASGGDGAAVQYWFVGYDPTLESVIVAHQGTDRDHVEAVVTDFNLLLVNLDPVLFPSMPKDIKVHYGFAETQARSALDILSAVQTAIHEQKAKRVTLLGHSLGGALALLDSVYLSLHLVGDIELRTVGYGMPRVGNEAFANYVDAHLSLTRINNKLDPVPIMPGQFMGYHHSAGEVHISQSGEWFACSGQENESPKCSAGILSSVFDGLVADHNGPYGDVDILCYPNVPITAKKPN